ncbi:MAG: hypothetical protein ACFHXK_00810 [bacterium]
MEHALITSPIVLLSWVFAKPEMFRPLIERFSDEAKVFQIYLVAEESELYRRLTKRNDEGLADYALEKLRLINSLPFAKIDTTLKQNQQIAAEIINIVQSSPNE